MINEIIKIINNRKINKIIDKKVCWLYLYLDSTPLVMVGQSVMHWICIVLCTFESCLQDDDSDLEYERETLPSIPKQTALQAAACVQVGT
jgi:hypothetical protein